MSKLEQQLDKILRYFYSDYSQAYTNTAEDLAKSEAIEKILKLFTRAGYRIERPNKTIIDLGYELEDFKESYRKFHKDKEPPTAFIVDLIAMQASVLADADQLLQVNTVESRVNTIDEIIKKAKPIKDKSGIIKALIVDLQNWKNQSQGGSE